MSLTRRIGIVAAGDKQPQGCHCEPAPQRWRGNPYFSLEFGVMVRLRRILKPKKLKTESYKIFKFREGII